MFVNTSVMTSWPVATPLRPSVVLSSEPVQEDVPPAAWVLEPVNDAFADVVDVAWVDVPLEGVALECAAVALVALLVLLARRAR